jgi:hypothetical protein
MTKDRILRGIKSCAKALRRAPSYTELQRRIKVTRRAVRKHFGTYTQAVRACGLEREGSGHRVETEVLFRDWAGVVRKIGKLPTVAEYELHGKYSVQPLMTRFKSWKQTPLGLALYAEEHGLGAEWADVVEMAKASPVKERGRSMPEPWKPPKTKIMPDRPTYGPPMMRGPMAFGPENENGVLFLFGAKAEKLGFVIKKIQTAFPDCIAMREVEPGVWQEVRIELEKESRNFVRHMHDLKGADIIVCWKHNWPECPLEVIELGSIG